MDKRIITMSEKDILAWVPQPNPLPWMAEKLLPATALPLRGATWGRMLRVVAKEGLINDWAAYAYYAESDASFVSRYGDKLTPEEAVAVFPFLDIERYRA